MLFSKLSAAFLAFASIASSNPLPYNGLAVRDASAYERGLIWAPRSLRPRGDNDRRNRNRRNIIIQQNVNIQLTQIQIIQEVQIVNVIQNIIIVVGLDDARDNVRKNHYKNRRNRNKGDNDRKNRNKNNNNNDNNVVIIVVVVVVDARDVNNQNRRFMTRQIETNPEARTKEWVVVTQKSTMTIDSQNPTAGLGATAVEPAATGAAVAPEVGVYDPAAPLALSQDALLPAGIEDPSWPEASVEEDPASILEADQGGFVSFD